MIYCKLLQKLSAKVTVEMYYEIVPISTNTIILESGMDMQFEYMYIL